MCAVPTAGQKSPREIGFIDLHPAAGDLRSEVIEGLESQPRRLPAKLFYDEKGSALFERITELPEYYLTRTETAILQQHAGEMAELFGRDAVLIEFGSGSSTKVRILLDAAPWAAEYMPIDISRDFLRESAQSIADEYPDVAVTAVCADYTELPALPETKASGRRVVFFPGSTIGNLDPHDAENFLRHTRMLLNPGDGMLIGVDLAKDRAVLDAAYNDSEGVTASFNLNILERLNRELGADFDLSAFEHVAFFNEEASRIEMHLRSTCRQQVRLDSAVFELSEGECIHTENSYKYGEGRFRELVSGAGFSPARRWMDENARFAVHWLEVSKESER